MKFQVRLVKWILESIQPIFWKKYEKNSGVFQFFFQNTSELKQNPAVAFGNEATLSCLD